MSSKVPIVVGQIAWVSAPTHIFLLGLIISIYYLLNVSFFIIWGVLTYFILSYGLRNFITRYHQKGMKFVKQGKFKDAIIYFEKSVEYFSKNVWLDKYRFLTMLSSSKMTYREMGLCNIAFCYSQIGNGLKAKEFYELALKDYPDNVMAKTALNFIASMDWENHEREDEGYKRDAERLLKNL